jgi:integrator complex subunit 7
MYIINYYISKINRTFATTMCTKVSSMVKSLSTPIDLKRRLVPIFQHMHHDVVVAATVRHLH